VERGCVVFTVIPLSSYSSRFLGYRDTLSCAVGHVVVIWPLCLPVSLALMLSSLRRGVNTMVVLVLELADSSIETIDRQTGWTQRQ